MNDIPVQSPQLTCDHHYVSTHQADFPVWLYWIRRCDLCGHLGLVELKAGYLAVDPSRATEVAKIMREGHAECDGCGLTKLSTDDVLELLQTLHELGTT